MEALEAGSLRIFPFSRTARVVLLSFRCAWTSWKKRIFLPFLAPLGPAPGARWGSSSWTSTAGKLYLFGGQGDDSNGDRTLLNDLWTCTPGASVDVEGAGTSSCPWSLAGGSTTRQYHRCLRHARSRRRDSGRQMGCRRDHRRCGNFWMFGGQGVDSAGTIGLLNDLWEYNSTANQWTWIGPSPSSAANQNGSYGTLGTGTGTTAPGGRQAAVLWADTAGNIWLFGGFGLDSVGTGTTGPPPAGAILNDLWEFNITTKQWTWVSGSNLANQTGNYGSQATSNLSTGAASKLSRDRVGAPPVGAMPTAIYGFSVVGGTVPRPRIPLAS